ncbi:MAG: exodeoxyribonuclease III [Candidatus Pacebacteria bacterium]|nr:exodeoxyribonuclease III [Candidatus Paceibacterota bacterium]
MKIYSWNINGLRAILKKPDFANFLKQEKPDILCLQEIKISEEARQKENIDFKKFGYAAYWNSADRPGYSGTLTLIKNNLEAKLPSQENGVGVEKFDSEGRVQTLEFPDFFLVNTYFPHSTHELSRLDYKMEFDRELREYIKKLNKQKPVIVGGDFNVAHQKIDLARPKDNVGNPGFTDEERDWMTKFLNSGFTDTYRALHPNKIQYSWWSYRAFCRDKDIGWRLDYFCVPDNFLSRVKSAQIHDDIFGSDHCPVSIEI